MLLLLNQPTTPRLYAVIAPDSGWTNPTATQILNGRDGNNVAATWFGGTNAPTSTTTFDWPSLATGLTSGVSYRVAFVWYDGTSTSNVAVSSAFTTTGGATAINCGVGVATATGLQASVTIGTVIASVVGTATSSGLQAGIAINTAIAGGIGTAAASGLQALIALPTAIAAEIGTATATGLQATITVGSAITISGGIGTATASGLQAALTFPTSIAAGIGEATASGLPAGITFPAGGTIIFGVGSAAASGLQALIREIGVSGGASVRGKKRGWANERAALEESLRQVDRIAEVMAESDEPQAQAIAEELEDYSGEVEQIEILRERLQALQSVQRRKELTAQKERDVQEAARELKAILDDDEEIAEVLDSMLHIEFRALRMIGVM